jgi:membrane protease YdiL (CAAX protease family)
MAPAAIVLGFGLGLVGSIAVSVIAGAAGSSLSHPTPAVTLVENLVFDLGFVGAAIYFGITTGRLSPGAFGFRPVALGLASAAFLAGGLGYYVLTAVYASLFRLHGSDKLPSELGVHRSTAALIGAAVFVCVVAPIAEETFFRGFVFGALRRWRLRIGGRELGTVVAAIITGILFGLAHTGSANPQYLVPLGFLGFILCLIRWRTDSLYPCMALHSFNNSLALGLNELHWKAGGILGLMVGALLVIAVFTAPLATRGAARSTAPAG